MNTTEDRLRAAFAARAERLTEPKLDELAARHQAGVESLDHLERGEHTVVLEPIDFDQPRKTRHRRWVAPLLAAAAVAAVAIGAVTAISQHSNSSPAAPPASGPNSATPPPKSSTTTSPTPKTSGPTGTLNRGQTGLRTDVPWSAVGVGWRLIQPWDAGAPTRSLYLYNPAGGRYRITTELPADADVVGWSPDGARASLQLPTGIDQLDLRSGTITTLVSHTETFVTYTRPQGLAVLGASDSGLQRYGLDGSTQLTYSNKINGIGLLGQGPYPIFYTTDGSAFVADGTDRAFLIGNNGDPLRAYNPPAGTNACVPIRAWDDADFLEFCTTATAARNSLYLQPIGGGAPRLLIDRAGKSFTNAWPLSNKDVLVEKSSASCAPAGYQILHPDNTVSDLRLPTGVPAPGRIVKMDGDLATFTTADQPCNYNSFPLIDYNMVTGDTEPLLPAAAWIVPFPRS